MIDMHIHVVNSKLPGSKTDQSLLAKPAEEVAAMVVYKNNNVWADLSGLLVGDAVAFEVMWRRGGLAKAAKNVADAIDYSERPDRFLYGSDWPLAPMRSYRSFIESIIPEEQRKAIFAENARELFRLPPRSSCCGEGYCN